MKGPTMSKAPAIRMRCTTNLPVLFIVHPPLLQSKLNDGYPENDHKEH